MAIGQPLLGIYSSQISGHLFQPVGAYELLTTATVSTGGASNIVWSAIPQTYTHLQIRAIAKDSQSSGNHSFSFVFNGDLSTNYTYHGLSGDGSTASAGAFTGLTQSYAGFISAADTTNIFAASIIDILDYSSTVKNKVTRSLAGADLNGSGQIFFISTAWLSTAAITSIQINPASGQTFSANSSFALYGIKG